MPHGKLIWGIPVDNAANEAAEAPEEIREAYPDGVRGIE